MALIQVNYLSRTLFRTVPLNVVLPTDKISFETMDYKGVPEGGYPTLYLLHGLLGNYTDWVSGSRVQRWAEDAGLAVVMPSGDNAFYIPNQVANSDYGKFVAEELPRVTRDMFPLSRRREDTFIAGLSMGGFGALRNGMLHPETFSHIGAFSAGIHFFEPEGFMSIAGEESVFGDMAEAAESDKNYNVALAELEARVAAGEAEAPRFYISCGTQDHLYKPNRRFADKVAAAGWDLTWDEEPAGHEWDFWDSQVKKLIDWLPLGASEGALGSGNIAKDF